MDAGVRKEVDGMGTSEIKYGDSVCYIQHVSTGLWLTYQAVDVKSVRMGAIQRKVRGERNPISQSPLTAKIQKHKAKRGS